MTPGTPSPGRGGRGLRVLMSADTVGGVWSYALELARALVPLDVEVSLATMGAPLSPAQARAAAAVPGLEVFESRYALEWMRDPWRDVDEAGAWLLALARRLVPDVVHLNGYAHAVLPFAAPVVVVAHSCVATWWRAVHGDDAPPSWDEYRRRVTAGLRAAAVVIAPTAAIRAEILDAHGVTAAGRVIANGRDRAAWAPGPKRPFVLAAGRLWDRAKGLDTLDACAATVRWPIEVAGPLARPDGDDGGGGDATPRAVRLLGELTPPELAARMAHASIYALPARYEPFGLSALEAALSGCALVLGDLATLREVWDDAARYVPPGDADALGGALEELIEDAGARARLADAAHRRASAYPAGRMARAYRALYDEVCA
jgi:glycogen(starch) synthase